MKMKSVILSMAMIVSSGSALASDVEAGVVKKVIDRSQHDPFSMNYPLDLSMINSFSNGYKSEALKAEKPEFTTMAAAKGIQYFEVFGVGSSKSGGFEYLYKDQSSTANDHGDNQIRVAVLQYGYGNINQASFDGQNKSPSETVRLCGTLGVDVHACRVGETVTGWLYYFDFYGSEGGYFSVSSNSIASPFGYWSDSVSIL